MQIASTWLSHFSKQSTCTPSSLKTLTLCTSLSFICNNEIDCLATRPIIIYLVLLQLMFIRLQRDHLNIINMSIHKTMFALIHKFRQGGVIKILMHQAIRFEIIDENDEYYRGPSQDPCGMLPFSSSHSDSI